MIGSRGEVIDWNGGHGHVLAHGERWMAKAAAPLDRGQRVRVRKLEGLTLEVEPEAEGNPAGGAGQ
jgi:membrane-bound serine protease (ClpP class)